MAAAAGAALLLAVGLNGLAVPSATAATGFGPVDQGVYTLATTYNSGVYLDVPPPGTTGTQLDVNPAMPVTNRQQFQFYLVPGTTDDYYIVPRYGYEVSSGKDKLCLDVTGGYTGEWTGVQQYPCTGGWNQKFKPRPDPSGSGRWAFMDLNSGKYMGVDFSTDLVGIETTPYYWNITWQSFKIFTHPWDIPSSILATEDPEVYQCPDWYHLRPADSYHAYAENATSYPWHINGTTDPFADALSEGSSVHVEYEQTSGDWHLGQLWLFCDPDI